MQTGVRPLRLRKSTKNLYALLIIPYAYFLIAFVYRNLVPGSENNGNHYGELFVLLFYFFQKSPRAVYFSGGNYAFFCFVPTYIFFSLPIITFPNRLNFVIKLCFTTRNLRFDWFWFWFFFKKKWRDVWFKMATELWYRVLFSNNESEEEWIKVKTSFMLNIFFDLVSVWRTLLSGVLMKSSKAPWRVASLPW